MKKKKKKSPWNGVAGGGGGVRKNTSERYAHCHGNPPRHASQGPPPRLIPLSNYVKLFLIFPSTNLAAIPRKSLQSANPFHLLAIISSLLGNYLSRGRPEGSQYAGGGGGTPSPSNGAPRGLTYLRPQDLLSVFGWGGGRGEYWIPCGVFTIIRYKVFPSPDD